MRFRSPDPDATRDAAAALGRALGAQGLVLSLVGELGAGKTAFVKGLALGLGLEGVSVASPTFVIASEYETPAGPRLVHVDLYRVESVQALEEAGFLDMLEPGAVVAVEWADRFPEALPRDRLELRIEREAGGEGPRRFEAQAAGARAKEVLESWREELERVVGLE
ncbi:MAG: tRNA (adenosine(37)-N6)-threonylcarbamoyltransferase complex ATPase subunit type 1 TsaE [Deltaproteobacteria bacterium]|nr:tRNA (adenosine(37)-N6)-threonylcarbamoyltransferase complex ATPase subunit type 1 TsaE [Deltaproteobacteria bacterium]MBW2417769.1 tRNA (adenosine(37)-N6)-threonylcarbamoyltransferase complex ATPase subunit type 1 TsaE [Deltaproteobacteria bacterium]